MRKHPTRSKRWWQEPWLLFVISLPSVAVIAGITTVVIAVSHQDSLVRDDWYKSGKAINLDLARDRVAAEHGISAQVVLAPPQIQISLTHPASLQMEAPMTLFLQHHTIAELDRTISLERSATTPTGSLWVAPLTTKLVGKYQIELSGNLNTGNSPGHPWRLLQSAVFPRSTPVTLSPLAEANQP